MKCPKCGCPPWYMIGLFEASMYVAVNKDGSCTCAGRPHHVGKPVGDAHEFECGGGHRWPVEQHVVAIHEVPSIEEIAEALEGHRAEIIEANEWRPLAEHVRGLIRACTKGQV